MKKIMCILVCMLLGNTAYSAETWTQPYLVEKIFTQAVRENTGHYHSNKTFIGLSNMSWLPAVCANRLYFYIEKDDTHLYSLLLMAHSTKQTVRVAVTDQNPVGGVCRVTMISSPTH